ncbi:HAMP domain-containing histidine kinase [Oculatella sp. LEGE 06141]|uniref:sensor histidine kinase n=1 Tax=Oculatella sp. LEGE 06141 TaxID=1828648 RepID=UPI0018828ED6|nr:HAMP domain-containing sensor histidine kinase [Oculatella sp. LEGE 06141]MBE9178088.1 HAMP domain-containing histidine kinase [Oculatella sp. LEGE 06141]
MSWTNFAFLGIGLLVGLSIGWWLWRFRLGLTPQPHGSATASATTVLSDDSEMLALRSQLQHAQVTRQLADEMGQFKAGFLARTSHELRSPLNSVISLHQLILSDLCDNPAEERDFVAKAHAAALKMLSLLDELISVSKTAHGSRRLEIQPVQLKALLADVHRLIHLQAKNRSLRLEIEFPEPDLHVMADPRWLRQVLVSLLDTPIALMYEGTIRLTLHPEPATNQIHIWIEDERPSTAWHEAIDLMTSTPNQSDRSIEALLLEKERLPDATYSELPEDSTSLNPGLGLLLNQMVMEMMQGRLELLATPCKQPAAKASSSAIATADAEITRIQCTLPLATDRQQR